MEGINIDALLEIDDIDIEIDGVEYSLSKFDEPMDFSSNLDLPEGSIQGTHLLLGLDADLVTVLFHNTGEFNLGVMVEGVPMIWSLEDKLVADKAEQVIQKIIKLNEGE